MKEHVERRPRPAAKPISPRVAPRLVLNKTPPPIRNSPLSSQVPSGVWYTGYPLILLCRTAVNRLPYPESHACLTACPHTGFIPSQCIKAPERWTIDCQAKVWMSVTVMQWKRGDNSSVSKVRLETGKAAINCEEWEGGKSLVRKYLN